MAVLRLKSASLFFPLLLGGCCYLMPCHRSTYLVGTVRDGVTSQPVTSASIRLYHYETRSASTGCFAVGGPDGLPFEFGVSAPGYRPLVIEATPGSYDVAVKLMPLNSAVESASTAREITREQYTELSRSCR